MAIREFRGRYRFLSNFYGHKPGDIRFTVTLDGMEFHTTEHGFMAAKTLDMDIRREIQELPNPGQAKRFWNGRREEYRPGWYSMNIRTMLFFLRQKFQHPELRAMLLATDDQELVEGNNWGDTFFGVDQDTGEGENHLGRLLMQVRDEIRKSIAAK